MMDAEKMDLAAVDASLFSGHMDTEFTLQCEAGEFPVTLTEVAETTDHRGADEQQRRAPFSIVFECKSALLPQGMYTVTHKELPACDIYLSPFEGGEGWCKLEAVFN